MKRRNVNRELCVVGLLLLGLGFLTPGPGMAVAVGREEVTRALELLPRGFVENRGQWDEEAAFAAVGFYGTTWVSRDGELRHVLFSRGACDSARMRKRRGEWKPCPARAWVLSERFVGGKVVVMQGRGVLEGKASYFLGNDPSRHRSGLSTFRYVELGEVYPGVRVQLSAGQRTVEKVFEVLPGADAERIWIELEGAEGLRLGEGGVLVVRTGYGEVAFSAPVAWQEEGGERQPVAVAYRLDAAGQRYGFELGAYDRSRSLWIDPILQSTYVGAGGGEIALVLVIHPTSGEVYVTGETDSLNFPNTPGGAQAAFGGATDAFVARLNAALTSNLQSTYLGGSGDEAGFALRIHPTSGEVYVAGYTSSPDFPNTAGGAQAAFGGGSFDAFVARFNPALTVNLQSSYLGGSAEDRAYALAIHPTSGEVYLTGPTVSPNFPNVAGGAQVGYGGGPYDAFVARLNAALTANPQSSYIGGTGGDYGYAIAVHPASGDVYIAGETDSPTFPNTAGGAQAAFGGGAFDAIAVRFNAALTSNLQSSYLGGAGNDYGYAIAIHPTSGEVYVAGWTDSPNFPNTAGGAQAVYGGGTYDAFVARLNAPLTLNPQSTYVGGAGYDAGITLAIHPSSGQVYVVGLTDSSNFPNTAGGAQAALGGGVFDAFAARLNPALTLNPQSTYLGGSGDDIGHGVAIHPISGEVYVAGGTDSSDFPNTSGGAQPVYGGGFFDAFVTRLTSGLAATSAADMVANGGSVPSSLAPGSIYNLSFTCTNSGPDSAVNATCGVSVSAGIVSGLSCSPAVPAASLPAGGTISCTYTLTAPGSQGGGDTPETGITFTFTTGATNDSNAGNNTLINGPIPLVDALDDAASFPPNTVGATFNVGLNDQYGTGSLPGTASFTLLPATTCAGASINGSTGVATFNVPASGTCLVVYQVCVDGECDHARLVVTGLPLPRAVPMLQGWALVLLFAVLAGLGIGMRWRAGA